jgi:iron complex outermembrane receptor protein
MNPLFWKHARWRVLCVACLGWPLAARASDEFTLHEVVVTPTRAAQARADVAASVDVVNAATIRLMGPQINLSEALQRVPGLAALNRQNYAQDLQISSRGFGARSAFGVRGVRLYADGIPATMPDGQGQSALFDLGSAERVEVLRGPASALYGNAAGGVVQVFTEDGPPVPELTFGVVVGRDGLRRESLKLGGESGAFSVVADVSHVETDGWREHSAAQRDQFNTKLRWLLDDGARVTLVANYLNMPDLQDPLGLTVAQWRANPQQADKAALDFNTRKAIENSQVGVVYERGLREGQDTVRLMAYDGSRQVRQYQALPTGPQNAARHPGGVIDFARDFSGLDARYTWRSTLASGLVSVTGGVNIDQLDESRQGYQNFVGLSTGVLGALRRDEDNTARNSDQYLQVQWVPAEAWDLGFGVRHSRVRFKSEDHYIVSGNGNDSGSMHFSATTPTASVMFKQSPAWHVYATAGRSFETPTLNEVAYRTTSGTDTGWNFGLKASRAEHLELGVKAQPWPSVQVDAAVFHIDADDEIAIDINAGGRATYHNVGRSARRGLEAGGQWRLAREWTAQAALSWTEAHYLDSFSSTTISGNTTTTSAVAAGNGLPGVASRLIFVEMVWRPASKPWQAALEVRHMGSVWVNDLNTEHAPPSTLWALRATWRQVWAGGWRLDMLTRIDNLANTHAVGSVIVNEGNKRYYEGAPGRSLTLGASLTYSF